MEGNKPELSTIKHDPYTEKLANIFEAGELASYLKDQKQIKKSPEWDQAVKDLFEIFERKWVHLEGYPVAVLEALEYPPSFKAIVSQAIEDSLPEARNMMRTSLATFKKIETDLDNANKICVTIFLRHFMDLERRSQAMKYSSQIDKKIKKAEEIIEFLEKKLRLER
ncbi:MAG TPA: hypothetical protein VFQ59_01665 [Candidatus Paceibacterota bacterium]|nr:hypothetical protein [Candidatus Paceibacterota bacterium]